jgi:hypothetical protein
MSDEGNDLKPFTQYVPGKTTFEKKVFSIEEFAAKQGLLNNPHTSDTEYDEGQTIIKNGYSRDHTYEKQRSTKYLSDAKAKLEKIRTKVFGLNIESIYDNLSIKLQVLRSNNKASLEDLSEKKGEKLRQRNFFKQTNNIFYDADYPTSALYHFSILGVIAIVESLANAYFFAQGNDLGLLGGYLEATLISVVNIGSSLLVGVYLLPFKNYYKVVIRIISYLVLLLFSVFILIFNLGVGHYRDLRSLDPLRPVTDSLQTILKDPLNLTLNGSMLFAIGIGVAIYATSKAYKSDDPYPKYGQVDRKHKQAHLENRKFEQKCKYELEGLFQKAHTEVDNSLQEATTSKDKFGENLNHVKNAYAIYKNSSKTINNKYIEGIKRYRKTNIQIRTSPAPDYFNVYEPEFLDELENQDWVGSFDDVQKDLAKHVKTNETKKDEVKKQLKKLLEEELNNLQEVISKIDKGMSRKLREQDQFMIEKDKGKSNEKNKNK